MSKKQKVLCTECKYAAYHMDGRILCERPGVSVIAEVVHDDWCIFGEVFDGSRFDDLSSCDELEEIENGKRDHN